MSSSHPGQPLPKPRGRSSPLKLNLLGVYYLAHLCTQVGLHPLRGSDAMHPSRPNVSKLETKQRHRPIQGAARVPGSGQPSQASPRMHRQVGEPSRIGYSWGPDRLDLSLSPVCGTSHLHFLEHRGPSAQLPKTPARASAHSVVHFFNWTKSFRSLMSPASKHASHSARPVSQSTSHLGCVQSWVLYPAG